MKWNSWTALLLVLLLQLHAPDTRAEGPSRGFWIQGGYGVTRIDTRSFSSSSWKKHEHFEYFALGAGFDTESAIGFGVEQAWLRDTTGLFSSTRWKTLRAQIRFDPWRHAPISIGPVVGAGWGNTGRTYSYVDRDSGDERPGSYTARGLLGELGVDLRVQPGSWLAVHGEALYRWSSLYDTENADLPDQLLEDSLEGWVFRVGIRLYLEPYAKLPRAEKG